jgi:pantothenate synthetase
LVKPLLWSVEHQALLAIAGQIDNTRLIDNLLLKC